MTEGPLGAEDLNILARISTGNDWLRSLLCTLARRGTRLRHREPQRAAELIRVLSAWPWFKGGQFLFDLMEWEDFMVDGPPPPPLPQTLTSENWRQLEDLLVKIRALFQAAQGVNQPPLTVDAVIAQPSDADLPPLDPGLYLYRDVVLGLWASATAMPDVSSQQ